jgi:predicted permease
MQDIRYAIRILAKNPAISLVAILTLALGIGADTAIFSLVNAVVLRPLPYPEPERLVTLMVRSTAGNGPATVSPLTYHFWSKNATVFEAFAAISSGAFNIKTESGAERVDGLQVTSGFFRAIGVQPFLGRGFIEEEDRPGAEPVVVLSYGIWRQAYGGAPDIVGRRVLLNDRNYTVIGVLPDRVGYPASPRAIYSPLTLVPDPKDRGSNYTVVARLKRGVTMETARAEMDRIHRQFRAAYPDFVPSEVIGVGLTPFQDLMNADIRPLLNVLMAAVSAVLLIACANVANLLVSRTAGRRKELAIREAVGAGSGRIFRQLVVESLVLSLASGAAGVMFVHWGARILVSTNPALTPGGAVPPIDVRVLIFSFLISLTVAVIFGTSSSFHARKVEPQKALKAESLGQSTEHRRLSDVLVISEVALAMVLLVSASFLIITFYRLQTIHFGFNTEKLVAVELSISSERYKTAASVDRFERELRESVRAIPGVLSVATASAIPLVSTYNHTASLETDAGAPPFYVEYRSVSPEYFGTLGIRLSRGRGFLPTDKQGSPPVVLINETLARRFPASADPIGQRLTIAKGSPEEEPPREIAGIVTDISDRPPGAPIAATVYVPRSQASDRIHRSVNSFFPYSACLIRTAGSLDINRRMREIVAHIDPRAPVTRIRTIDEILADSLAGQRFNMVLMSSFSAVALFLTTVGLYCVLSYQVTQRTREIGVRAALGATRGEIVRIVMQRGMKLLGTGIALGLGLALLFAHVLAGLFYGVTATDPWVYVAISFLLVVVGVLATYIPARRAASIDPLVALRYE